MKRLDRLLNEARLMRIRRAGRTQGAFPSEPGYDWMAESGSVQVLLDQLGEDALPPGADARRVEAISIVDNSLLAPFIEEAVAAVVAVVERLSPQDLVFASAIAAVRDSFPEDLLDIGRAREGAVRDVAVLAVQASSFEIVRRVAMHMDAGRPLSDSSDPASIVISGGRARRLRQPRRIENAAEISAAGLAGRPAPAARLAASPRVDPDFGPAVREARAKRRLVRDAEREAERLAAAAPAAGPVPS